MTDQDEGLWVRDFPTAERKLASPNEFNEFCQDCHLGCYGIVVAADSTGIF